MIIIEKIKDFIKNKLRSAKLRLSHKILGLVISVLVLCSLGAIVSGFISSKRLEVEISRRIDGVFETVFANVKGVFADFQKIAETSVRQTSGLIALDALKELPNDTINLVLTSPPYALHFQKEYGNVAKSDYVEWFLTFAKEIYRILPEDGSFVLNIGGSYNKGKPQ